MPANQIHKKIEDLLQQNCGPNNEKCYNLYLFSATASAIWRRKKEEEKIKCNCKIAASLNSC